MNRIIRFFFFLLTFTTLLTACQDDLSKDKTLNFTGDSLVARWALGQSFPSQLVYNYGKSGAGISYIESQKDKFAGEDVVVIIGTNDYNYFLNDGITGYSDRYLSAVSSLTDKTIYLYSLLPRDFSGDPENINNKISSFNELIEKEVKNYPKIVYLNVFNKFMDGDHLNYQYYSDGLHINDYGYQILATELLDKISD